MSEPKTEPTPVENEATEQEAMGQLQADVEKFRDLAMRAAADLDNYRKRAAREKDDAIQYANAKLLERLLPVVDNFELGLAEARKTGGAAATALVTGMEMVFKQLQDFLTDHGVKTVDAVGQPFDPHVHDALSQEASADVPEGQVIRQLRKGYKLKDRLLRPANVVVSKGTHA
jgi:molecular chaperone GrpE